jgi:LPS sulfotransferase NodH
MEINKFLIIYTGRCGSSYLESLLNSHPKIDCSAELLYPGSPYNIDGKIQDPDIIFDSIVPKSKAITSIGFKVSVEHFAENLGLMRQWIMKSNAKCIHIKRYSQLDQFISLKLAQANNAWTSEDGIYKAEKIMLDSNKFIESAIYWEKHDTFLQNLSEDTNGISIGYEALNDFPQFVCEKIVSDLSLVPAIESHNYTSTFKKQRTSSLKEVIQNLGDFLK